MDLLPPRMKLQIFVDMPWRIRLKTCLAPLAGKSPQEVMTPAVADPTYLGYAKLYRMMLDLVRAPSRPLSLPCTMTSVASFTSWPWSKYLCLLHVKCDAQSCHSASRAVRADSMHMLLLGLRLSFPNTYSRSALQSMRPIARALRVFAHAENLPIIIHCIHGKDRTGLIIALLLLLLGVDEPTVVLDYAKSELELRVGPPYRALPREPATLRAVCRTTAARLRLHVCCDSRTWHEALGLLTQTQLQQLFGGGLRC